MEYTQLKEDIKAGARSIYLLEGSDAYFRMHAEEQIKSAFLQFPELNFATFDGAELKGGAYSSLIAAVNAFPFMAEKRIIKVTDLYPAEGEYNRYLAPLFEDFPPAAILIIVNSQTKKGVDLKRKKAVTYVNCNKADEETVTRWAYITMKRAGVAASQEACAAIAAYCLSDMARVSRETEKLIEWAGAGNKVTLADVEDMVYKDADYRVYEMTNCVAVKNYARFISIAQDLLSKGFDYNSLISSLSSYFRNLLYIISCRQTDAQTASELKMTEYGVKKSREQAKAIGVKRLEGLASSMYSLACSLKSGDMTAEGAFRTAVAQVFFS